MLGRTSPEVRERLLQLQLLVPQTLDTALFMISGTVARSSACQGLHDLIMLISLVPLALDADQFTDLALQLLA